MKDQLELRIQELTSEFESGQKMLADLEARKVDLQATLLRISGAVQVLQEILADESRSEESNVDQLADLRDESIPAEPEPQGELVTAD